jgi:hypothetical protein
VAWVWSGAFYQALGFGESVASEERRTVREGGDEGELAAARAICRMLGDLPLALALAGAYLGQNPEIPLGDYRDRLAREGALAAVDDSGVNASAAVSSHLPTCQVMTNRLARGALRQGPRVSDEPCFAVRNARMVGHRLS